MKKTILVSLLSLAILSLAIAPALAQPVVNVGLNDVTNETGYQEDVSLTVTIGRIIKIVLGFLGLIVLILFIIGGFKWMVSGGNEEKVAEAKKIMSAAVVGLFIIIIAYAATDFIVKQITTVAEPATCTPTYVRCVDEASDEYVTCQPDDTWGTARIACTAGECTLGDIGAAEVDICIVP